LGIGKYLYGRHIFVFLLFVLFTGIGWLMNKLSAEYLRTALYNVEFYNSSNPRRIYHTKTDLFLQIKMNGFSAIRYKYAEQSTMRIDLNDKIISKTKNYILAADIFQKIAEQIGDGKKLISINPDTIYFNYNDRQSKRLPVVPNLDLTFASEYMQKGNTVIYPDSVLVSAEQNILNSLAQIPCSAKKYENLNESIRGELEIDLRKLANVSLSHRKVNFKVEVERYCESTITVPVQLLNQPANLNIIIFPREIEVKYRASIVDFTAIEPSDFVLSTDFNDFEKSINGNLKVNIAEMPNSILKVELYPEFVELIVNKK
jgi:YbbR domain-containing protein